MKNKTFNILELIENKDVVIEQGVQGVLPKKTSFQLLGLTFLSLAIFGMISGANHSLFQSLISSVKLPLIFLMSAVVCYPTLYLFLSLLGLGYSAKSLAQFFLICLAINGMVLLAFSPISVFFLITNSSYSFFKIINVAILACGGFMGVFLFKKYLFTKAPDWEPLYRQRANRFVWMWLLMYGLIGANLGFFLSPIFGIPSEPIVFITSSSENFFTHIFNMLF